MLRGWWVQPSAVISSSHINSNNDSFFSKKAGSGVLFQRLVRFVRTYRSQALCVHGDGESRVRTKGAERQTRELGVTIVKETA
jgi:hypothetical protein